ncbi:MAG: hypothetical protein ACP5RD_06080 [bacterium]
MKKNYIFFLKFFILSNFYIFIFLFFILLSLNKVFAGIELIEKKEGNFIVYYAKINKTIAKVFYIHKNYYSKNFIEILDYFTKNINNYNDIKYVYDDYWGFYSIFLKGKKLVSINKDLAFLSGYSSKEKLLNSYLILLRNYIDLIPPVFFEKNYLLTLVNKDYYLKIIKKDNLSYNLLSNENLEVNLLNDNLLKISPKKVGTYFLKLVVNYNNKIFEDDITIDSKIPVFDLPFSNYLISYSSSFDYIKVINWFDTIILPNISFYTQIKIDYKYLLKNDNQLIYYIFPKKLEKNYDDYYYFNNEKIALNFERKDIYNPINFDYLIITNNPEKISNEGLIYENILRSGSDYFIWFHHLFLNNKYFIIEIKNESDNNIIVNYYLGYSISISEIQSGINASYLFFDFINNNRFISLNIKPKKRLFLFCKDIPKDNTLTGFVYIKPTESLKIKIYTINDRLQFNKELNYLSNDNSLRSTGNFEKPFIQKELNFYLSNVFYSIRIPLEEEELKLANSNDNFNNYDYSNYGVLYKLKLNIINNTSYKQKVFLYGSSISGYTPFVFLYKGNIYRTDSGMYKNLLTFYLEPNEEIHENIYFLITPGLFYPIELELTTNKL